MTLAQVEQFQVPARIVEQTEAALRGAGAKGYEAFVLWSGRQNGPLFKVLTAHVPKQNAYRLSSGLCVRVNGDELHRLNVWLYEAGEILAIQIHAHPDEAYHSETDDTYPIVAMLGGLSIVAAEFCRAGLFTSSTAVYRLQADGWTKQQADVVQVM
ncbi:MAG: hypothetical protein ACRD2U_04825 [Terriglobales bacterium]